ncbi:hypothetical protein GYMLUDRAFT_50401 [Collybiopsis luxurians FD-317 M1]|uniref:Uncharacterized protein n=1 Tax=Collybiopsis luxurians FD-317 M1 TaxID=944289 RepID=A0A0D0CA32_9AGAR|nr:hypothetical protein GYMLUDRAFT_50401 [Collybiopsis luxurians FD-317 M1]
MYHVWNRSILGWSSTWQEASSFLSKWIVKYIWQDSGTRIQIKGIESDVVERETEKE